MSATGGILPLTPEPQTTSPRRAKWRTDPTATSRRRSEATTGTRPRISRTTRGRGGRRSSRLGGRRRDADGQGPTARPARLVRPCAGQARHDPLEPVGCARAQGVDMWSPLQTTWAGTAGPRLTADAAGSRRGCPRLMCRPWRRNRERLKTPHGGGVPVLAGEPLPQRVLSGDPCRRLGGERATTTHALPDEDRHLGVR